MNKKHFPYFSLDRSLIYQPKDMCISLASNHAYSEYFHMSLSHNLPRYMTDFLLCVAAILKLSHKPLQQSLLYLVAQNELERCFL